MLDQMTSAWRQAILLVCGAVGPARGEVRPYGPRSWDRLAGRLGEVGTDPAEILSMSAAEIGHTLMIPAVEGERLRLLLARSGQLAIELERLESRGIWVTTLGDVDYPVRLRQRLGASAPPLLYGSGPRALLDSPGVAIVGSRDADAAALEFTERLAAKVAAEGLSVVSGGARGIDSTSMSAAAERGGRVVGVLAESLERRIRDSHTRNLLADGSVALVSPYHPSSGFSVGAAMGRNKLIYALADLAVVVSTTAGQGGTWAGAIEALQAGWVPVYVRVGDGVPAGNAALISRGAIALPDEIDEEFTIGSLAGSEVRTPAHAVREAAPTLWDEV
jgi:predicted Rossmann fold nucleotide-binding protein DprA/Smf involved in DNA uptake